LCVFSCYNGRRRWNLFLISFNVFQELELSFLNFFVFLQLNKFVRLLWIRYWLHMYLGLIVLLNGLSTFNKLTDFKTPTY
jgi:hypothetical protein